MIEHVTLKEIYKETFRKASLIAIPNVSELLEVPNSALSKWETFYSIVEEALKKFEYYYPLTLLQKIYVEVDNMSRTAKITGNFDAYLKGALTDDQIVIVPASINGISTSFYTASTMPLRNFRYVAPMLTDMWYSTNTYYMNTICHRPFPERYDEVTKEPTDQCAIYYMSKDVDTLWTLLRDEIYCQFCKFVSGIKKNMTLQGMPIELFQSLEEDAQSLRGELDNKYQSAYADGYWVI